MRKTYQPQSRKTYVVKRAIKRELVRGVIVLFIVSFALLLTTFLVQNNKALFLLFAISGLVLCAFSMILFFRVNRCPYCGRMFKGLHWSAPNAGNCEGCGKLIQYTEKGQTQQKNQLKVTHQHKKK